MEALFLDVNDVCRILKRKPAYCYKVIRELNKELEEQGYLTNPGRILADYFYERTGLNA